ncbi:SDR family NAD(P)-dependent oxidoreductase [Flavobacterium sp. AG291]|uniref:SDR family NAD(P)-dependent oxidoreductase n=1 Tax=Flavobacterium sp. AG291 TaxID=2184000 RepID=UPI000E0BDC9F|nr:SDR family NAD(P)-dependent oxidoreductase [Flavobacterium sp. AG291]RDI12099.1 NADP-dependent 3-hydroxy acid dehydrogenase YdfG [Flavobacterium sp. AG291]
MKTDKQKIWFVTGASKGFGLLFVKQLLATGQNVAATSRTTAELIKTIGDSENFLPLEVDLASDSSVAAAIAKTEAKFGGLDVLVNNAGYGIGGSLEEVEDRDVRAAFDINVFAVFNTIRHTLPIMRKQQSGHIINIASIAGVAPGSGWAAYSAAKSAVIGLSEALAQDVQPFGITVTAVAPGGFRTSFLSKESLAVPKNRNGAYDNINEMLIRYQGLDGKQAGDPEKGVAIMIQTAFEQNPPLHLLLGSDAYRRATAKFESQMNEFENLKDTTTSTDF